MVKKVQRFASLFLTASMIASSIGGGTAAAEESVLQPAPSEAVMVTPQADQAQGEETAAAFGISTQALPDAEVGKPYTATIAVYGGEAPYHFTMNQQPPGLMLEPAMGTLSGSPEKEGMYTFEVTVTDSAAIPNSTRTSLDLKVAPTALPPSQPPAVDTLQFRKIAAYSVGKQNEDGGVAEIVKYNKGNHKFYLVNGSTEPASIDIVPFPAEGGTLIKEKTINVESLAESGRGFEFGDLTSLDINLATKKIAAAVQEKDPAKGGKILVLDYDGNLLETHGVGIQPDMVKFTSDGRYILTADEGEPRTTGVDPEGSVTVVDTMTGQASRAAFDNPELIADNVHIRGVSDGSGIITGPGTKEQAKTDLEPEYIALSGDEKTAYVSLQENNAIAVVDIASAKVITVTGLGYKDFNDPQNPLDLLEDGKVNLENVPFKGMYMPDGMASYTVGGSTYLFTANEGDSTDWDGRKNGAKISELTSIDPASAAGAFLKGKGSIYDKVEAATDMGTDGIYLFGARSFSVWNADNMQQIYDSGSDFERITAERLPKYFNSNHSKANFDKRSTKKGPEPEYVAVGKVGDKAFAFIGLERIGGVMVYDVTDPTNPKFANYTNTRDFSAGMETDTGPEGLEFIPAVDSPTGLPLLLVANEVGGTVAALELQVSKVSLDKTALTLEAGGAAEKLTATVTPGSSGGSAGVVWSSSDEAVATVDAEGSVTPKAAGKAVITVKSTDGLGEAAATVTVNPKADGDTWKLTVMHTNDTHAHLDEVARRATLVKQIRAEGGNQLLVDAGDVFSGDLYFTNWLGLKDLQFMNLMDYDAMTFGNHEFDKGTEALANFVRQAKFPLLSANIDFSKDGHMAPLVKSPKVIDTGATKTTEHAGVYPYVVLDVNGHKVGVFGMTTEDTAETSSPGKNVVFKDVVKSAKETVEAMEHEGLNTIIALSHLGYARDKDLASAVEGIDLIVGGHTHTKLDAPQIVTDSIWNTPTVVVQANEWGKYLGRVDVVFDKQGVVLTGEGQTTGRLIPVDSKVEEDPKAKEILDPLKKDLEKLISKVEGYAAVMLDGERKNIRSRETNLGNLIADGMLSKAKAVKNADIAIMNGGGIRQSIDQGDITLGEIRTVMPFGNTLFVLDVSGKQLLEGLENGVSGAKLPDLPGKFPQIAGMKFKWDPKQSTGSRVYDVMIQKGTEYVPLSLTSTYRLATNSFVANGGDGYKSFAEAISNGAYHEDLGYPDYEIFIEHIKRLGDTVAPKVEGRIIEQAKPSGGVGNGGGSSPGSSSGLPAQTATPKPETKTKTPAGQEANVLSGEQLQVSVTKDAFDQPVNQVSVKSSDLQAAMTAAASSSKSELIVAMSELKGGTVLSLPVNALSSGTAAGTEIKPITLIVRADLGAYRIPIEPIAAAAKESGTVPAGVPSTLRLSIVPANPSDQAQVAKAATAQGISILSALEFKLQFVWPDGQSQDLSENGKIKAQRYYNILSNTRIGKATIVRYDHTTHELRFVPALVQGVGDGPSLHIKRSGESVFAIVNVNKDFADLKGHWANTEIGALTNKVIIKGIDGTSFAPGREMNRAEFTALLVRALGMSPAKGQTSFSDISTSDTLAGEIGAAIQYGLVKADKDTFGPKESITRTEMASMIANAMRLAQAEVGDVAAGNTSSAETSLPKDQTAALARFSDRSAIPDGAASDIAWLVEQGIMKGDQRGTFAPNGHVTRAQSAVIVLRMLRKLNFTN